MKNKKNKGITLVALIVSIIVMLILVSVGVNVIINGNLFGTTKETIRLKEREEYREQLEFAKEEERIDSYQYPDTEKYPDVEEYFKRIEEEGLVEDIENDIVYIGKDENGDDVYEVTTKGDHVFKVTETEDEIIIEGIGDGKTLGPRIVKINVKEATTNSIEIEVETRRAEEGTYTYKYKKNEEDENSWKEAGKTGENTYKYTGLEANQIYNIKVEVETKKGKTEAEVGVITGELPTGTITFGEVTWNKGEAKVTATNTATDYEMQYQVNGIAEGKWTDIENIAEISGLKHEDTVYARVWDGSNGGEHASVDIRDEIKPTVTIETNEITSNGITITVTATDNESGMLETPTYTYYIKKTGESTYVEKETNTNATYTFTELKQNTEYDVKVKVDGDKAGNSQEQTKTAQKTAIITPAKEEGAITFGDIVWSNGKASTTINTNTKYKIEYQINDVEEGKWSPIENGGTVSEIENNSILYARLTDGENSGDYTSLDIKNLAPSIVSTSFNTKTTNSITVNVRATDANGDKITYTIYTSKSPTSGFSTSGTSENNESGTQVTVTATGLEQFQVYYYYITANDGIATTTGATSSAIRTYCPGTGQTCTTLVCNGTRQIPCSKITWLVCSGQCGTCGGLGYYGYCAGGTSQRCYNCGGLGYYRCTGTPEEVRSKTYTTICPGCGDRSWLCKTYECRECNTTGESKRCTNWCGYPSVETTNHDNKLILCLACGGYGSVINPCSHYPGYTSPHYIYNPCNVCWGSGLCGHPDTTGVPHSVPTTCQTCLGLGYVVSSPCDHGDYSGHRYCAHYPNYTTLTSHSCCSHGYVSQHDN